MSDDPKSVRQKMTTHELLLSLHERLDEIDEWRRGVDKRLAEGHQRFDALDRQGVVQMRYLASVNNALGRKAEAGEIEGVIAEHFPSKAHKWDDETAPNIDRASVMPGGETPQ